MMRHIAAIAMLAGSLSLGGCAPSPPAPGASKVAAAPAPVCLKTYFIDHTHPVDDSTLLFFMRDGKVWKNTLRDPCVGLQIEQGFSYEASVDEICSNEQTIRVLRTGSICQLGDFTPVPPDSAPKG